METAGRAVARVVERVVDPDAARGVVVLAGPGNNGGDGCVVARVLHERGYRVRLLSLVPRAALSGDAAFQRTLLERGGALAVDEITEMADVSRVREALASGGAVVDALFGTGLGRPLTGVAAAVVAAVNEAGLPVVAVDIPSGVNGTTGHVMGCAVQAHVTVCLGSLKRGVLTHPGAQACGALCVAEIGIPSSVIAALSDGVELTSPWQVRDAIPARDVTAHKGTAGRLTVVAGSRGMSGAAVIATSAGLRTGAGLVTLCLPESVGELPAGLPPEALRCSVEDAGTGLFCEASYEALEDAIEGADAVAVGPGIGRRMETLRVVSDLLDAIEVPTVVDADALRALPHCQTPRARIVTPHAGEMATLLGCAVDAVTADPIGSARACAQRFGVVTLLKGNRTVVASPAGDVRVNATGNPGMASGGMGDALTGIIGGLLAQGAEPFEAAVAGAFIHGMAADAVACERGERGILARDVIDRVPCVLERVRTRPDAVPFPDMV